MEARRASADADTPPSGIAFRHGLLTQGRQMSAIGGNDSGSRAPGSPAMVMQAAALPQAVPLDGIRAATCS